MHFGLTNCHVPFLDHCEFNLSLRPNFNYYCVWSISLILFEIEIPNLMCVWMA